MTPDEEQSFAASIAIALYGVDARTVYHPERPRKQKCVIYKSESSVGGVHDMEQVAHGETWKKAAIHAVLSYRFQMEDKLRKAQG